jgi:hypothetical protein
MDTNMMELKSLSADQLAKRYAAGESGSLNHVACEGEFKRRELYWIRFTAIIAAISFIVMGMSSVAGVYISYLNSILSGMPNT